jgi:proteasome lid subunit RPN8/RPN11
MAFAEPTLVLDLAQYRRVVAHCYDGLPDEACGLFAGAFGAETLPTGVVGEVYPCRNADASARTYTIDAGDYLRADRDARDRGLDVVGGWHSHTHTEAYPSTTDVAKAQALGPAWLLAIVSLKRAEPSLRAYRIVGEEIHEIAVRVEGL